MIFFTRKLVSLFLCSSLMGQYISGMDQEIVSCKSKKELFLGIKGLPLELKRHIVYVLLQTFIVDFQLYKTLQGHTEPITSLALSPDGETFLTGSRDNTACIWSTKTGEVITTFIGHTDALCSVAFSPDGEMCLTSERNTACIWSAKTGNLIRTLTRYPTFSRDGQSYLTGYGDTIARLCDSKTGNLITTFTGHTQAIWSLAFSPDGQKCLTGSGDTTACIWNIKTGNLLKTLIGHTKYISSVAFSPDGQRCLTGSGDTTVCVWNSKTGKLLQTLKSYWSWSLLSFKGHGSDITSVAFSPDGEKCITVSYAKACLWNIQTEEILITLIGDKFTQCITSAVLSPDGETVLTRSSDSSVHLWDSKTGERLVRLESLNLGAVSWWGDVIIGSSHNVAFIWKRSYDVSCLSDENKSRAFEHFIPFYPLLQRVRDGSDTEAETSSEPLLIKGIDAGLDINSEAQKNCIIS